ncbi:alpha-beta hydrolase superfamily lysophospholipase [Isoptericola sp. CG 20/1183]|uniref:Alpha-beta hydrolase superfamily lysophospholipase n=1 Tax=Isoptericola halotolerans TaxID=300560 RepID=A0ABX5EF20_9MICO|nr:alpha-beta hydrolase superfamily lysophospholipase [Isoptericola halotolerans]PRZ04691.1 alpha-beta hydrolase superfamily lysophospholipase [Isoptericola sp. CG 20/1183]
MSSYGTHVPALPNDTSPDDVVWEPDPLLDGFVSAPVGPATLVRRAEGPTTPRGVVLHVHGYNDYFFQDHLADAVHEAGYVFYAVDLRRAGRSLLRSADDAGAEAGIPPHFTTSLQELGGDLDAALSRVRAAAPGLPVAVHAHSTGALTTSMWSHARGADGPDAVVLNSPFLDLAGSWLSRQVNTGVLGVLGRLRPLAVVSTHPSVYATYQHVDNGGRWRFDTDLKKPEGQPVRAAWLRAVRRAQLRLARGLDIPGPVLVARCASSGPDSPDNPGLDRQDTVLDTRQIARLAPRLGPDVTQVVVDDGVHDLTLSADGPRQEYLGALVRFLADRLPAVAA